MLGFQLQMFLGVAWVKASIFFSLEPDGFITSKKMQPGSLKGRWEGRPHPISIGLQGEKLTSSICTVAIVGRKDNGTIEPFEMIDVKRIQEIIESMEVAEEVPPGPMMTCSWAVHHHQFWVTVLESWVVTRPCSQVSTSWCSLQPTVYWVWAWTGLFIVANEIFWYRGSAQYNDCRPGLNEQGVHSAENCRGVCCSDWSCSSRCCFYAVNTRCALHLSR
jgi:hypothetical protein